MGHRSPDENDPPELRDHWVSLQERFVIPERTPAPISREYLLWSLCRRVPPQPLLEALDAVAIAQPIFELQRVGGIGIEGRILKYKGDRGWDLVTGSVAPGRPVIIRYDGGHLPRDVMWARWRTWLHPPVAGRTVHVPDYVHADVRSRRCLIVDQRCVDTLRAGGVSGWRLFPIEFEGKRGEPIEGYHGLAITGHCASIDLSAAWQVASGPGIHHVIRGISILQNSWDGSDLFVPATGEDFIFATQRARDALAVSEITGVWIERIDGSLDDTYRRE
jgi:hypothetical protein